MLLLTHTAFIRISILKKALCGSLFFCPKTGSTIISLFTEYDVQYRTLPDLHLCVRTKWYGIYSITHRSSQRYFQDKEAAASSTSSSLQLLFVPMALIYACVNLKTFTVIYYLLLLHTYSDEEKDTCNMR